MPCARIELGGMFLKTNLLFVIEPLIRHIQGIIMKPPKGGLTSLAVLRGYHALLKSGYSEFSWCSSLISESSKQNTIAPRTYLSLLPVVLHSFKPPWRGPEHFLAELHARRSVPKLLQWNTF